MPSEVEAREKEKDIFKPMLPKHHRVNKADSNSFLIYFPIILLPLNKL